MTAVLPYLVAFVVCSLAVLGLGCVIAAILGLGADEPCGEYVALVLSDPDGPDRLRMEGEDGLTWAIMQEGDDFHVFPCGNRRPCPVHDRESRQGVAHGRQAAA